MKKIALTLAALVTSVAMTAQDTAAVETTPSYSVTADFPYTTKYVFRGIEFAEDSIQPSVKLNVGNAYAGVWMNQPLDSEFENEVDFFGGYTFALEDGWSLDLGATAYHYPELDTSGGADDTTFEGYAGLTGTIDGFNVSLYAYNDFTIDVFTLQGGLGYSLPINDTVSCNFTANVGWVNPDAGSEYMYYGASAQFPIKINDKATVTLGANYATHDMDDLDDNHFWLNAGFTYAF